jgi:hypothetical protein
LDHAIGNKVGEAYRDTSLIGHRRILNERYVSFLTGVAYTGCFEAPGLPLVVDNAAWRRRVARMIQCMLSFVSHGAAPLDETPWRQMFRPSNSAIGRERCGLRPKKRCA